MIVLAKLLLLILCALLHLLHYPVSEIRIMILLTAMILSCLPSIIRYDLWNGKGLRIITGITWLIYSLGACFFPELIFYLPLAVLDLTGLKLILPLLIVGFCFIVKFMDFTTVLLVLLSALAGLLQFVITRSETLETEIKKLRDTSKEHELLIEEKNRRLIEKQDADIYTATLKERNRIAREIHDNVGHMLTRSILQVGALKAINSDETMREPLEGLHDTLNTAMTNIRSSVHDLHDESIDLHAAISEIIDRITDLHIHLQYDMGHSVPRQIKYCFISITKEAINNTIKHSNATTLDIIMQEHPAFYQLLIQDNGTGIQIKSEEGMGLTNMRDRVMSLNGNIKFTTENGFKILISIIKNRSVEE